MKKILILGGGVGGALVANLLSKKLKKEAEITILDKSPKHIYQPGFLYVPFGWENPDKLVRDQESLLNKNINFVLDEAVYIDTDKNLVTTKNRGDIGYDYLVLATGSHVAPEQIPGLKEAGHHFYGREQALNLKQAIENFKGGNVVTGIAGVPHKCPVAPLEFTFMFEWYLKRKGLREKTNMSYVSPLPRCFSIPSVSDMVTPWLEERNINNITFFNVESVDPKAKIVHSIEGDSIPFDLLMLIPPHRGAKVITDSGLAESAGWLDTDRYTMRVNGYDNIFAIGDATNLPVSKAGSSAHFQADALVGNIISDIRNEKTVHHYDGHVMCFLETGYNKATLLNFDYNHPPNPAQPNYLLHMAKILFNKTYWWTLPQGRLPNTPIKDKKSLQDCPDC